METKVTELISEHFGISVTDITPGLELRKDLNATDLEIADFFLSAENAFNITIPQEDAASIYTVEDFTSYITDHVEEAT